MVSSSVRAVAVLVLLVQSAQCWFGVWALHDITVEGAREGGKGEHWDYGDGPYGPAHWHELNKEWAVCKTGKQQSPIAVDLKDMVTNPGLGEFIAEYRPGPGIPATIVNEGHAVVVEVPTSPSYGYVMINFWTYRLQQFHYHMPSEHKIMNQSFPLEIHMVYKAASRPPRYGGTIAVVSFLFVEGEESEFLAQFADNIPSYKTPNIKKSIGNITLPVMAPNYGRYIGSLTTPPCTEEVIWTINLWNFPTASKGQLKKLRAALPQKNNRPTFPSTGRGFSMWP